MDAVDISTHSSIEGQIPTYHKRVPDLHLRKIQNQLVDLAFRCPDTAEIIGVDFLEDIIPLRAVVVPPHLETLYTASLRLFVLSNGAQFGKQIVHDVSA